jgi:hypothetical protein
MPRLVEAVFPATIKLVRLSGFLLDTNCISELVRPKPDPHVIDWMDAADEALLFLSVLTLGEIRKVQQLYRKGSAGHSWKPGSRSNSSHASINEFWLSMPPSLIGGECSSQKRNAEANPSLW